MFDIDSFIEDCLTATKGPDPRRAAREVLVRTFADAGSIAQAMGDKEGGIHILHNTPQLTVLNVIWAPGMKIMPHDHQMWAAIGIYGGVEDNTLYRRGPDRIQPSGGRELREGDVLALGTDAIHAVANPERRFTGALHVYGGDFVNQPRSQWDPDTLLEQPYDMEYVARLFAEANRAWAEQLATTDVDEQVN